MQIASARDQYNEAYNDIAYSSVDAHASIIRSPRRCLRHLLLLILVWIDQVTDTYANIDTYLIVHSCDTSMIIFTLFK